jgi:hypothetical protein
LIVSAAREPLDGSALVRVATFLGTFVDARGCDPALPFAGVLALATIARGHTGALALTTIASDTLYVGLICPLSLAGIIGKNRLREKHSRNRNRKHCAGDLSFFHFFSFAKEVLVRFSAIVRRERRFAKVG